MSFLWKKEILNSEKNKGRFKRKIKGFFEKTKTEVKILYFLMVLNVLILII